MGYTSERFGTAGIEAAYNDTLRGEQNFASFTDVVNSLAGISTRATTSCFPLFPHPAGGARRAGPAR